MTGKDTDNINGVVILSVSNTGPWREGVTWRERGLLRIQTEGSQEMRLESGSIQPQRERRGSDPAPGHRNRLLPQRPSFLKVTLFLLL